MLHEAKHLQPRECWRSGGDGCEATIRSNCGTTITSNCGTIITSNSRTTITINSRTTITSHSRTTITINSRTTITINNTDESNRILNTRQEPSPHHASFEDSATHLLRKRNSRRQSRSRKAPAYVIETKETIRKEGQRRRGRVHTQRSLRAVHISTHQQTTVERQGEREGRGLQTIQNVRENPERQGLHQQLILKRVLLLPKEAVVLLAANKKERSLVNEGIERRGCDELNPRRVVSVHTNTNERTRVLATILKGLNDALRKESHVSARREEGPQGTGVGGVKAATQDDLVRSLIRHWIGRVRKRHNAESIPKACLGWGYSRTKRLH